ncbi:MAG TPA: universal stress protein [Gaiellaceae bacterium]|nr:universal stress protein [Gaiellaceae bacterium]
MFDTVIWATDGSEAAERALPFATTLAGAPGTKLIVVHVRELLGARAGVYPARADDDELVDKLEQQADQLRKGGLDASLRVVTSLDANAAHAIADVAMEVGANVIVIGTRGRGLVAGLVLGSVTQRLLHVAHCPVLAVPPQAATAPEEVKQLEQVRVPS